MEAARMTGGRGEYETGWVRAPVAVRHDLPVRPLLRFREDGGGGAQRNGRRDGTGQMN